MLRKDILLEQLDQVRSEIIEEEKELGRTVRVCSDTVLHEIREKRPLKLER
jgi:hypothetical protein